MKTISQQDRLAAEAVRSVPCPVCWAGAGGALTEDCGIIPAGNHFARWALARRRRLITAEQAGAALDSILVITGTAMVTLGCPA